ncbi:MULTISPECIES: zinc-binding dehydrogenase [unclassified Pseudoclavibacter]|uniref:zinc-binding dehydrogenase n=1 Tax=unclassified Pseudoclavibacter TaxID=2615177 RepID=UPI0021583496|nr:MULTISPECIES: zinc-binding dehydrogenase [unclassified Pseudoclavibacter]
MRSAAAPRVEEPSALRIHLQPAATAMVWLGVERPLEAVAVPDVVLGPGEVLVALEFATICGSDVHTMLGHRQSPAPGVLGHEYVGRVVATGGGGARTIDGEALEHGARIVWSVLASCGECDRCTRGLTQKCRSLLKYGHERLTTRWELSGGFATHMHLRSGTGIVAVDETTPAAALAPVTCGTATAVAAMRAGLRVLELDSPAVLVSGAGLIGLTVAALARDRGCTVVVADPDGKRRDLAARFGAHAAIDPGDPGAAAEAWSGLGLPGPDIVIEASGSRAAVSAALDAVEVGGAVVLVGSVFPTEPVALDPESLVRGLVTVRGVHNYTSADLAAALEFVEGSADRWPFAELVEATFPLERLGDGVALAATGGPIRVGIDLSTSCGAGTAPRGQRRTREVEAAVTPR